MTNTFDNFNYVSIYLYCSSRKILNTRFFEENDKRWMKSVRDLNLEVLCVSQFTLYFKHKGNKLDFSKAMEGINIYEYEVFK